jgi:CRISPR-associated protein Csm3
MAIDLKLRAIKTVSGRIVLKSGLHIGAGSTEMHIGGMDNPVVKHPHTNDPYIPGSSLKGKIRALLELKCGLVPYAEGGATSNKTLKNNEVAHNKALADDCRAILKLFGSSGAEEDSTGSIGPTRLLFSDCYLDEEWKKTASDRRYMLTEEKAETAIDRITGTAKRGSLRQTERVLEGTVFSFLLTCRILKGDDEDIFKQYVLDGLKLLELDALGGSGSRGYGRVKFTDLSLDGQPWQETFDNHGVF